MCQDVGVEIQWTRIMFIRVVIIVPVTQEHKNSQLMRIGRTDHIRKIDKLVS